MEKEMKFLSWNVKTCERRKRTWQFFFGGVHCSVNYNMQTNKTDNIHFDCVNGIFTTIANLDNGKLFAMNLMNGNIHFFSQLASLCLLFKKKNY